MTRGQYIAMLIIGAVAALAWLQSYTIAQYLKGGSSSPVPTTV